MVGPTVTLIGSGVILAGVASVVFGVVYVLGMRAKWPAVTRVVIGLSRRWVNPGQLRVAGQPGVRTGVVRHRGRSSGRAYATPVDILPWEDGFVIALPYGMRSQWVRNVLAAGRAEVIADGRAWAVDRPELVPTDTVIDAFGSGDGRLFRLFHTDRCLRLRRGAETGPVPAAA